MNDELLFREIKGQATEEERRAVDAWRRSAGANDARYRELKRVTELTNRPALLVTTPPAASEIIRRADARARRFRPWVSRAAWAAAGVAALLTLTVVRERSRHNAEFGFEEMVTGDTQPVTVSLKDGSVMRLAPRSRARIRVHDGAREVHLVGRAFFSVAKRDGLPFVVRTEAGDVTVLGTQFDLDARNADVRVVVVEGKVALAAARGGEVRLTHGQEARIVEGQLQPTILLADPLASSRWVGHFLAFRDTPLSDVAREIGQAYGVKVTIADSTLAAHTVTDWFSDRSLDEVVRVVCAIVAAECTVRGAEVTVGRAPR
jgi:ferric-dicitrate binding protein FerR (iron transport regulator)